MNDYKELIGNLRYWSGACDRTNNGCQARFVLSEAADAIEQLVKERDAAIDCIYAIEDDLDRGNDNDWAREHIKEWRGVLGK